ncbi:pimeloyl-ACP methyl ester carboxylesterase [Kineococcus xinjiangensis]|uniref:Pimeloyl-ACP methyl ester carboxylesterase n=1 Tax=Kineococcus xinjiangensis TaxID=512762 RepID=A0A2S6ITX6_9ACTN|nr:alpha/beta hydrolase [Kineococcus xinjiangensis]PPK97621.1 pimeloyl-ACP methyl ester carboxylesterase [Kineococcus xinjiangensis]
MEQSPGPRCAQAGTDRAQPPPGRRPWQRTVHRRTPLEIPLLPGPGPGGWAPAGPRPVTLRWHHREAGTPDGRAPLVLLHGLGMSSRSMVPLMTRIAPRRVLAPDLPGSGGSRPVPRPLRLAEQAEALLSWLDALDVPRVVLVGHSYGAQVAVATALRAPERVERLVLAGATRDPSAPTTSAQALRLLRDVRHERPAMLAVALSDYLRSGPRRMVAVLRNLLSQPEELHLAMVDVPALVVQGSRDPVSPAPWCRRVADLLPRGELAVVPDGAHGMVFSQPDAFWAAVRDFCDTDPA